VQLTGIAIDVTQYVQATEQLRQANERLLEADRQKDDFLAVLSHELRNPLMPIKHGLYVINRTPPDSEQARRAKVTMERQVDQITRLVNDLLDVSRISRGKVQLQRERFDLRQAVSRTLEDFRPLFAPRAIRVEEHGPDQPVWINGDSSRVAQVLGNLLHNAAKFTRDGGSISVTLAQQGAQAVLRVDDDGAGIARELLERIFEPFIQAEQNLARSAGGLGLGLALVKGLVELHGGTVEAQSEGAGRGSHFTVRLPIDSAPVAEPRSRAKHPPRHTCRVLVIEDNVDNAETLSDVLKLDGHEVSVSYSGADGISKARSFNPDVVFCDIGLPGMNGYDVARAFRSDTALRGIALVALTGYGSADDREKAVTAGFNRHLIKPPMHEDIEVILSELPQRPAA
jgi:two-component system CheB/CheR fusion protein